MFSKSILDTSFSKFDSDMFEISSDGLEIDNDAASQYWHERLTINESRHT